jgi:HD-like signal output (HDOD) protein
MNTAASLIDIVSDRLNSKDDFLPAFDTNAFKIQQEASKENPDIQTIEKLIVQDQALTSQVLKLANSSFFKGLSKITTVKNAIMRLGTSEIANIVLMVSQRSGYMCKDRHYQKIMDSLWRHSIGCAMGSVWICKNGRFDVPAQEAFFAGLMHDIGKLLVLAVIADARRSGILDKNPPEAFLEEVIQTLHTEKG